MPVEPFDSQRLFALFDKYCKEHLVERYQFGVGGSDGVSTDKMQNYGCNPFIETEDDYKVKFGGFLESELWGTGFCVHSELNRVYGAAFKRQRPDLSIHSCNGSPWLTDEDRLTSLQCLIELKGANIKHPYYEFTKTKGNTVFDDMKKLASFANGIVIRCLVFLDELNLVGKPCGKGRGAVSQETADKMVERFLDEAGKKQVLVLSNNPRLMIGSR